MNGPRVTLRVLAVLLASVLLAAGVLTAVEIAAAAVGQGPAALPYPALARTLRAQSWQSGLARAVGAGLCVLGLLLLWPVLRRGKPSSLRLRPCSERADTDTFLSRRGLQKTLAAAAGQVDGVHSVRAIVRRRKVRIRARSGLREPHGLTEQVDLAARHELNALTLHRPLTVKVTISRRT